MKYRLRWVLFSACAALLAAYSAGCSYNSMLGVRTEAAGIDDVGDGEIVAVGRVILRPALSKDEQNIQWGIGTEHLKNAFLATGDTPWSQPLPDASDYSVLKNSIQTPWNQWFYVRLPKKPFMVQGLIYYPTFTSQISGGVGGVDGGGRTVSSDIRRADFPAALTVDVRPEDKVVFIGTFIFGRDEFNAPKGIQVYGDLKDALPEIKARFGSAPVRVSLAKANN